MQIFINKSILQLGFNIEKCFILFSVLTTKIKYSLVMISLISAKNIIFSFFLLFIFKLLLKWIDNLILIFFEYALIKVCICYLLISYIRTYLLINRRIKKMIIPSIITLWLRTITLIIDLTTLTLVYNIEIIIS